jgi:ubiquinone/menaquinone biosynthesis C-methylase UbiE
MHTQRASNSVEFDFDVAFDPDDYLYFYQDRLSRQCTDNEIAFLIRELNLQTPARILDLACGHGRHANGLAKRGHSVTGIDRSDGFLKLARTHAAQIGVGPAYIQSDMREIDFHEEFDAAIILFTSFGFLSEDDNFRVLQKVASALKPAGMLCFDILNRDVLLARLDKYCVKKIGADLMIDRYSFDFCNSRLFNKRITIRGGKRSDRPYSMRVYNFSEIQDNLNLAGLKISKIYGNWDSEPFKPNSEHMIIIAQKE